MRRHHDPPLATGTLRCTSARLGVKAADRHAVEDASASGKRTRGFSCQLRQKRRPQSAVNASRTRGVGSGPTPFVRNLGGNNPRRPARLACFDRLGRARSRPGSQIGAGGRVLSVREVVRDAALFARSASCDDNITSASPSPPSTGACCSGSATNSHSLPSFQGPRPSPGPCDML